MFENGYTKLVMDVLSTGEPRETRNGLTRSIFSSQLVISELPLGMFPILRGRKMFYKGVLGELAAILRRPTCNGDFVEQGCNYWRDFADADGSLRVDYGNAWFDFNGHNQIADLKQQLRSDPTSRRMIISGWNPANLADLSLPCCHLLYQFYLTGNNTLHMKWYQRSVDVMVGLPSDAIFASAWLLAICNEFDFKPGKIVMDFGDTHIYEEHVDGALQYLDQYASIHSEPAPLFCFTAPKGKDFCLFEASDLEVLHYNPAKQINFKLKV